MSKKDIVDRILKSGFELGIAGSGRIYIDID